MKRRVCLNLLLIYRICVVRADFLRLSWARESGFSFRYQRRRFGFFRTCLTLTWSCCLFRTVARQNIVFGCVLFLSCPLLHVRFSRHSKSLLPSPEECFVERTCESACASFRRLTAYYASSTTFAGPNLTAFSTSDQHATPLPSSQLSIPGLAPISIVTTVMASKRRRLQAKAKATSKQTTKIVETSPDHSGDTLSRSPTAAEQPPEGVSRIPERVQLKSLGC